MEERIYFMSPKNKQCSVFSFPILRVDRKEYLEELQCGKLFMRTAMYYQQDEEKDPRYDSYDCAVPTDDIFRVSYLDRDIRNGHFVDPRWYVKCFYGFRPSDVFCKCDGIFIVRMGKESKEWFSELNNTHALLINNTFEFMRRFYEHCKAKRLQYLADAVQYIDDDSYFQYKLDYAKAAKNSSGPQQNICWKYPPMPLCKRKKFSSQQEVRLCVAYRDVVDLLEENHRRGIILSPEKMNEIRNMTKQEEIGSIADISEIYTIDEIFKMEIPIST